MGRSSRDFEPSFRRGLYRLRAGAPLTRKEGGAAHGVLRMDILPIPWSITTVLGTRISTLTLRCIFTEL